MLHVHRRRRRLPIVVALLTVAAAALLTAQGPLTVASNLRVRTDASGYLLTTGAAYTSPDGPLTPMANIRIRTDANGYLLTTSSPTGGSTFYAADGLVGTPSYSFASETNTGFYRVQSNFIGVSINGTNTIGFDSSVHLASTGSLAWTSGLPNGTNDTILVRDSAAGVMALKNGTNAQTFNIYGSTTGPIRLSMKAGTPGVSVCGDGALQTGSTDSSGRVVGTTQTACTITFSSTGFGGNAADCLMENLTANRGNITAASATAFTVSNLTAGDDFMYHCFGR